MKVIKEGRPQKGWAKEFECTGNGNGNGGCGAILLVEQADIFKAQSLVETNATMHNTFQCPCCKIHTIIPWAEKLPFVTYPR